MNIPPNDLPEHRPLLHRGWRVGYFLFGCLFLLLGLIGAVLPLMPTTVFLIAAAWAFGRSSPRLERWLLGHPACGPMLVAWRKNRVIPRRAKVAACCGMIFGFVLFLITSQPRWWLACSVFVCMFLIALWIIRHPESIKASTSHP